MASTRTIAATRFGYGFHPHQAAPGSADDLMAQVRSPGWTAGAASKRSPMDRARLFEDLRALRRRNADGSLRKQVRAAVREVNRSFRAEAEARLNAAVLSPEGFYERLAWFWSDHFAVRARGSKLKSFVGDFETAAIRPHIGGRFHDMLAAAATHPAMLLFLDQWNSVGPNSPAGRRLKRGLNENLAREVIELHTLGAGADYSQADIRQFAELLTGLSVERETGATRFRPNWAEPGAEKILGVSYGGGAASVDDIRDVLNDLADRPETATHIAWKLARHFTADAPDPDLVASMRDAYVAGRGDLSKVYEAMLAHPAAWSIDRLKVKQPFDYVASALRAVGASADDLSALSATTAADARPRGALARMNQRIYEPEGPDGWPEDARAWITPQGLTARIRWASALSRKTERRVDPRTLLETALGDAAQEETRRASARAPERWQGVMFVLASPEFNRR